METAPLTLAYTHARNAAQETKRSNPVAASEEHDLAAAEFATAAQGTKDDEALRILNLLEQHHKRLGQILKSTHLKTSAPEPHTKSSDGSNVAKETGGQKQPRPDSPETSSHPPRLPRTSRQLSRDLSSSIASNLASKRGIPSVRQKRTAPVSPLVSNQHADATFTQEQQPPKSDSRRDLGRSSSRPSWVPPVGVGEADVTERRTTASEAATASDAPFQQFYSTFESLVSKLSAPLAFAGLPLTTQAVSKPESSSGPASPKVPHRPSQKSEPLQASVDYSQLISSAALRAVRNENAHRPSESFLIVPTSGGTASYADIMSRVEREARGHRRDFSNTSNDDFVDASSQILPARIKSGGNKREEPRYQGKTMEELTLENETLRQMSDAIAKRLHVFEMSAQSSSAALAHSIRGLGLSPVTTPENSRGKPAVDSRGGDDAQRMARRIGELEDVLKKYDKKLQKRDDENAKLKDNLSKYKEKWDSLKAGAKARREAGRTGESPRKSTSEGEPTTPGKGKDKESSAASEG